MALASRSSGIPPYPAEGLALRRSNVVQSISWKSELCSFTKRMLRSSSPMLRTTAITRLKVRAEKDDASTQAKSVPQKVAEPDIRPANPDMEREIWEMFMRAEATEEKALDELEEREATGAPVTTVVLESQRKTKQISEGKKFLFHTAGTGKVHVAVKRSGVHSYVVEILVDTGNVLPKSNTPLKLHWGLFRSDSTEWVLLEPDQTPRGTVIMDGVIEAMQTPFIVGPRGVQTLSLTLEASMAPLFVNFVLLKPATADQEDYWIRGNQGTNFCIPIGMGRGCPDPLGVSWNQDGSINFALYSRHAKNVVLCLYEADAIEPSLEIDLERTMHRTGDVWHIQLESLGQYTRYGYRCKGQAGWESGDRYHSRNVLLDPYAKFVAPHVLGQEDMPSPAPVLGLLQKKSMPFDWEDHTAPRIPLEALVAYRLHVGSFTGEADDVHETLRGTFLGILEKVPHLLSLGVNAVILQPVFTWDESRGCYYPVSFFSVMSCYGPAGDSLSANFALKKLVKELHRIGIEVILDVVYSHTAENGDDGPKSMSFRGIDNSTYYICDQFGAVAKSEFGTENSFNCNHPIVQKLIMDSLQYFVDEFHIDGFCFKNSSCLITGPHGQHLSRPVLVEAITFDPLLSCAKLIADSCSPINGMWKKTAFPHWKRWCEWNNQFKIDVRRFMRGEPAQLSRFATRLCGSGDMFADGRGTRYSFNHVTAPYGLTLTDVVSYSDMEGEICEYSWNCGHEGPVEDPSVIETRIKQVRNFLTTLFLSQGVPVLNMGDEYGYTKEGMLAVENSTCFQWEAVESEFGRQIIHLIASLVALRSHRKDLLQRGDFLDSDMLTWHGMQPEQPLWESKESNILAVSLHTNAVQQNKAQMFSDLYIAYNPHAILIPVTLPEPPKGMIWVRIADTSLPFPSNFHMDGTPIRNQFDGPSPYGGYDLQPHSSLILEARPGTPSGNPIRASLQPGKGTEASDRS